MSSYVMYRVSRYDIKGKQYLTTGDKYYLSDIGLRNYLLGKKPMDMGHILENIVFLELLRRGNEVYIGKIGTTEVDFITNNENGIEYYQVSMSVRERSTLEREFLFFKYNIENPLDTELKYDIISISIKRH